MVLNVFVPNFELKLSNSANLLEKNGLKKSFVSMYIFKITEVTIFLHDCHKIKFAYTFVMWGRPQIVKK